MEITVLFDSKKLHRKYGGKYLLSFRRDYDGVHQRTITHCVMQKDHKFWFGTTVRHPSDDPDEFRAYKESFGRALAEFFGDVFLQECPASDFFAMTRYPHLEKKMKAEFWRVFLNYMEIEKELR